MQIGLIVGMKIKNGILNLLRYNLIKYILKYSLKDSFVRSENYKYFSTFN